jgi:hypothetical protein
LNAEAILPQRSQRAQNMNCPFPKQLPFSLKGSFNFLNTMCPGKNREIFGILQSHNHLSPSNLHHLQLFAVDNGPAAALKFC